MNTLRESGRMRTGALAVMLAAVLSAMLLPIRAESVESLTYSDLVRRMTDLEWLATLPPEGEKGAMFSSYDRASVYNEETGRYENWDANGDGHHFIRVENGLEVLAEMEGPGCIWRIWSADARDGAVRIYLDGAEEPAVDLPFSGYFSGENAPFNYPSLVYITSEGGGLNNYVPIPFQESCKIVAEPGWGLYYNINYSIFPEGTSVPTFRRDLPPEDLAALARLDSFLTYGIGTDPAGVRAGEATLQGEAVASAQSAVTLAEIEGPQAITAIKIQLDAMTPEAQERILRELALQISWDGETRPSVWAPLGDFFGSAPGINPYESLAMGMFEDELFAYWYMLYSYWYMPFAESACIQIVNDGGEDHALHFSITHAPLTRPVEDFGRFHAKWHRDAFLPDPATGRGIDWTLLTTTGRGRYCGTVLNIWNYWGSWWGEGDEKFFVDGEKFPSTFGTGSEDYFGYAWCLPVLFERPFHNKTRVSPDNRFHVSVNRWHIADSVPFQTSFEGAIEKYFPNSQTLYSAVAYWYLNPDGVDPYDPVPVEDRVDYYFIPETMQVDGALEAEDLPVRITRGITHRQDTIQFAFRRWSAETHLWWTGAEPGDRMTLAFPVEETGHYDLIVAMTKARDYAIVQIHLNDQPIGEPIDLFNGWVIPTGPISLGIRHLEAGDNELAFEIVGANPEAVRNYMVGVDYILLDPANPPEN